MLYNHTGYLSANEISLHSYQSSYQFDAWKDQVSTGVKMIAKHISHCFHLRFSEPIRIQYVCVRWFLLTLYHQRVSMTVGQVLAKPFSFVYKLCCVFQNFVLHIILRRLWLKTLSTDYVFKCVNSSNCVQVSMKQVPFSYTQPNNSEYIYIYIYINIAAFLICIYIYEHLRVCC